MENPKEWAEKMAESAILSNLDRYIEARELGKEFSDEVRD